MLMGISLLTLGVGMQVLVHPPPVPLLGLGLGLGEMDMGMGHNFQLFCLSRIQHRRPSGAFLRIFSLFNRASLLP